MIIGIVTQHMNSEGSDWDHAFSYVAHKRRWPSLEVFSLLEILSFVVLLKNRMELRLSTQDVTHMTTTRIHRSVLTWS